MSPRTEQELLDATIDLATTCHWAVHHDRPARRAGARWATAIQGHAGFPDLCLSRRGLVIFRELKGYDVNGRMGRLSSEQRDWIKQLDPTWQPRTRGTWTAAALTQLVDVWTPDDWPLISVTLTAKPIARAS